MAINLTPEQTEILQSQGVTKEQMQSDINKFRSQGMSDDDIQQSLNQRISELTPEEAETPVLKGSVETNVIKDIAKGGLSGLSEIPRGVANISNKYLRPLIGKDPLSQEELSEKVLRPTGAAEYDTQTAAGGVSKFLGSLAPYLAQKTVGFVPSAISGGIAGGVQAANEDKNILQGIGLGALTGAGTHGILKATPKIDDAILKLSGIKKHISDLATEKGSNVLKYVKELEEGAPEDQVRNIWERIRKTFNDEMLADTKLKTSNVKKAKIEGFKNAEMLGDLSLTPTESYIKELEGLSALRPENAKISIKERDLNKYIKDYLKERPRMSAEDLKKQIDLLDTDYIDYTKPLGQSKSKSEEAVAKTAQKIRKMMANDLENIMPEEFRTANKAFSEMSNVYEAEPMPIINKGSKKYAQKEAQEARKQLARLQAALKSPTAGREYEIIEKELPGGAEALRQGRYLRAAGDISNVNVQGERIPLSKWAAIAELATGLPRKTALNKILPKRLAQNEGTYIPSKLENSSEVIKKLLPVLSGKVGGMFASPDGSIDAEQFRNRR